MISISRISEAAMLVGDPARASMLFALKDDGEISSGALASVAGVAASTASEHLAKMIDAGLVEVTSKGRSRYYRLSSPAVAEVLEGIEGVAETLSNKSKVSNFQDKSLRNARCCYDHLAGRVGVRLADCMMASEFITHTTDGPNVTDAGIKWLTWLGVDVSKLRSEPRKFLRLCPDWSEKSLHIGGGVGAALLDAMMSRDWLRRSRNSKVIEVSPKGAAELRTQLKMQISLSN